MPNYIACQNSITWKPFRSLEMWSCCYWN